MANDATIIAGSLDSKELEKSINELINMVDSKLNGDGGMASKFQDGINKMQASLNSLSSTFRGMKGDVKDFASSFDSMAKARQQAINGSKTGGPDRITFDSDVEKGLTYVVNANKDIDAQLEAIIIKEQQMLATKNEEARATEATVAAQQNLTNVASGTARIFENVHEQQIRANQAIRDSSSNVSTTFRGYDNLRSAVASVLGVEREHVQVIGSENQQYTILASRLKMLQAVYNNLNASDRTSERGQELVKSMQQIERAMQKIRAQAARPVSLADAMSISEKTLDDMAYKMRMLSAYRGGLDVTKQKSEIDQINKAYNELKRKMDDIMQKNQSMMSSNNALARSWNYMKNRLAFYLTIGASTAFVKNLIEVRSQYEMNEKALGVLVNSAERGTQIFNELSQMSLVSPYTLIELSAAAKQLVAYDVAAKDVVDTTRRLADMASAVGVPIERLTYALGQIKAYGYLNARDARMFANAGIPLVKQLSDYYTELEGKLVSTADVYDRIKKKAIDYNDVMQVVNKMTDEGGKFFDFQAKMADTLKVRLANFTLAWNNMLNDVGKETQGLMVSGISLLTTLLRNWRSLENAMFALVLAFGAVKAAQIIYISYNKKIALSNAAVQASNSKIIQSFFNLKNGIKNLIGTPLTWWTTLAFVVSSAVIEFIAAERAIKNLNNAIKDGSKENFDNIQTFLDSMVELRNSFYQNEKTKDTSKTINTKEAQKTWESLREQIELTSSSSDFFISKLMQIDDVNKRVERSFEYLEKIRDVQGVLQDLDSSTIKVQQDWSKLWNANLGYDSVYENVKDVNEGLKDAVERLGSYDVVLEKINRLKGGSPIKGEDLLTLQKYLDNLSVLEKNLGETSTSINTFLSGKNLDAEQWRAAYDQITQKIIADGNMASEEQLRFRIEQERNFIELRHKEFEDDRQWILKNEQGLTNEEVQEALKRSKANEDAWFASFGESKALSESFYSWLKTRHRSEIDNMFGHLSKKEIETLDESVPEWMDWIRKNANEFSRRWNISFDDLWKQISDTNKMQIFIRGSVVFGDNKTAYDILTEADKAANDAWAKMERLAKRRDELLKKGISGAGESSKDEEYNKILAEITEAQQDYNKAIEAGGRSKKEDSQNTKNQRNASSELQKALKDELSLIDKVRSVYKDLRKEGASMQDALSFATSGYDEAIAEINSVFAKFSLTPLDLSKYAGVSNPRALLDMIQHQLDELEASGRVKPAEIQALQFKIKDLKVDAEKYDLTKITKGLNNELDKLKDEYELAVELDANPELGDIFLDTFGISKEQLSELPKSAEDAAKMAQQAINRELGKNKATENLSFNLVDNLNKSKLASWFENNNIDIESDLAKQLNATVEYINKLRLDETKKQIENWNSLLEKYAEYEYKRTQIIEQAEKERETARKKNGGSDILNAIDIRERRELAALDFEQFKQTPTWVAATGDLANLTNGAIKTLIDRLEQYKKSAKNLDPKQIKDINRALKQLYSQQRKGNPFTAIADAISEAKERFDDYQQQIDVATERIDVLNGKLKEQGELTKSEKKELERLTEQVKEWGEEQQATGKVSATAIVDGVREMITSINQVTSAVGEMFAAFGDTQVSENIQKITQVLDKAGSMAAAGAQIGGGWGAVVGGVLGGLMGAITAWADEISGNAYITKTIEKSERAVRRLELAYIDLEHAMNAAFGSGIAGTQALEVENKKLQLAELNRQLQLEESRSKKKYDEDRIIDLQSQIKELEYEIRDSMDNVMNELLGISSVGDAIENMVGVMIDALRNGDDAISAFNDSVDDMIANLIKKWAATNILAPRVAAVLESIQADIDNRVQKATEEAANLQRRRDSRQRLYDLAMEWGRPDEAKIWAKELEQLDKELEIAHQKLSDAGTYTIEDLQNHTAQLEELKLYGSTFNDELSALLDSLGLTGSNANKGLSALQAGIQGITEDQAGALEAYWNANTQQQYVHTDLLTQIRDVIVGYDMDMQAGVMSQMLLQLQQSYAVQMAIQNILTGWSNPSGLAVRVEMI